MNVFTFKSLITVRFNRYDRALDKLAFACSQKDHIPVTIGKIVQPITDHVQGMKHQLDDLAEYSMEIPDDIASAAMHDLALATQSIREIELMQLN